jgi:predicted dienelactone hydrolase
MSRVQRRDTDQIVLRMRCFVGTLIVTLMAIALPFDACADAFEAGFVNVTLTDPVEGGPMQAIVVYPTNSAAGTTRLGPFTIAASREAAPAPGSYPLIVFSHGSGGTHLGHHDSLTALARAGFVAAAVEHPRDNNRDDSGLATDLQMIGRPHHIVALIDGLLVHPTLGPLIDRSRIGMVGHSAGGYTALLIAGAVPDFALAKEYRAAIGTNAALQPFLQRADAAGSKRRKPELTYISDPRVRALVLWAPGFGYAFDQQALSKVRVPILLYRPSNDELVPHPWGAERIARFLPTRPEYHVLEGAGHFVFFAPCPWMLSWTARQSCKDAPGIDRAEIHERLNAEMITFFRQSLSPK